MAVFTGNGTDASPSFTFSSDTNTGIYRPNADEIGFVTNGTRHFTITSGGQLLNRATAVRKVATAANDPDVLFESVSTPNLALVRNDTAGLSAVFALGASTSSTVGGVGAVYTGQSVGSIRFAGADGTNLQIWGAGIDGIVTDTISTGSVPMALSFQTGTATPPGEKMRLDTAGRLLVGTSSASTSLGALTAKMQVQGTSVFDAGITNILWESSTNPVQLQLVKSRGASVGTHTVVQNNDNLGRILFGGSDGTDFETAAWIQCDVDGTPGTNDMPGRLVFSTTADGASSPTERMRITNAGDLRFAQDSTTTPGASNTVIGAAIASSGFGAFSVSGAAGLYVNRNTSDGTLVSFHQDGTQEGTISVSGTTVSYNGAHLSRWSQLSGIDPYDKTVRPEILRGTVMSNLDEMCDWTCPTSGDCQDNEQLNKTKISYVEGDKNVAGVFQSWDDDDDIWVNDFYLAMTGDFVIRIAAGTTVERGDLLMSAGDGTAKPQDDDIIRSKTIAKVTSTNVSCTHPDGSYCVPCVLMAC